MGRHWARAALCVSAFWCCCAMAHHSGAMFDLETQIELRGIVVDFKLRSPHATFVVDVQFLDGEPLENAPVRWEIEWESAPMLRTLDIEPDTFASGEEVTILAFPHRDRSFHFAHTLRVTDSFGDEFIMANSDRKFAPSVQRAAANVTAEEEEEQQDAASSPSTSRDLVGRWQQPLLNFPAESPNLALNEAGIAARRDFDPTRSPANTCEPMSVPGVFLAPFFLFEIELAEGHVILRNEAYNVVRTVPIAGAAVAVDQGNHFGRATARIVDGVLTVESSDFPESRWGLGHDEALGGADLPSSEQKTLYEQFTVSPDGRTLVYTYELSDPVYLTRPYNGRLELTRAPEGTPIHEYACDLESARMWSRSRTDPPLRIGN